MSASHAAAIVQKLWNSCDFLRDPIAAEIIKDLQAALDVVALIQSDLAPPTAVPHPPPTHRSDAPLPI